MVVASQTQFPRGERGVGVASYGGGYCASSRACANVTLLCMYVSVHVPICTIMTIMIIMYVY